MNNTINIPEYQVSQFNKLIKKVIDSNFDYVRVKGEISEVKIATRGQLYITLKDTESILSGVIWDSKKKFLKFNPEVGMEVIVTGRITTWSKFKTTYQIDIDKVEISGEGALLKLIEERKKKLKELGIFDQKHKKEIPFLPNKIGVITSPTGSVIYDIINRIKERFPVNIDIWPVAVQGTSAVSNIIEAIIGFNEKISEKNKPDVIIIARGGGSTEDLMVFNDEHLAVTVYNSKIPIISAIGHETDTTILDYVSDLRASTPTAAAEKAVPVLNEIKQTVDHYSQRLNFYTDNYLENIKYNLFNLSKFLKAPKFIVNSFQDKLENAIGNLSKYINTSTKNNFNKLNNLSNLLRSPENNLNNKKDNFELFSKNLDRNFNYNIHYQKKELNKFSRLLNSNSVNQTLNKGYTIVRKSKKIIKNSKFINENDILNIQFSDQYIEIKVKKKLIKSIML